MHKICTNMQLRLEELKKYARICINMHKMCKKYATNMQKYATSVNINLL